MLQYLISHVGGYHAPSIELSHLLVLVTSPAIPTANLARLLYQSFGGSVEDLLSGRVVAIIYSMWASRKPLETPFHPR